MNLISQLRDKFFKPIQPLPAGVFHYRTPAGVTPPYRLHLRLEPDGAGILIVNAKTVLHLNPTAAELIYHFIQQTPIDNIGSDLSKRYRVKKEQILSDYKDIRERIQTLISTPDLDPVMYLDFERLDPYSTELSACLRLDCALTYRQSDATDLKYTPQDRVKRELTSEEWKAILAKAWEAGIPHVVFTGGEPTLRPDLVDLITHTESLGQVTGLLTDGLRLSDKTYLHRLLQSGLDHLMIVLNPDDEEALEATRDVILEDIFTTIHLTITKQDLQIARNILERLSGIGVKNLSLSGNSPDLKAAVREAGRLAAGLGFTLHWDLPVPYSNMNPVALEMEEQPSIPAGAGKAWLYVEPDGDTLPAQGVQHVLGNLLLDPWSTIWQNAARQAWRE